MPDRQLRRGSYADKGILLLIARGGAIGLLFIVVDAVVDLVLEALSAGEEGPDWGEIFSELVAPSPREIWIRTLIFIFFIAFSLYVGLEKRRSQKQILHLAYHDELTGLPNRMSMQERLQFETGISRKHGGVFTLIFLDLDKFKDVNDTLGHDFGDELLLAVVQRFQAVLRPDDVLGRMGGDEFIILLRNANAQGAEVAADKLLGCMHQPCRVGTVDVFVTASIGLAVCPDNGTTPEELLKNADTAMFTAKRHGRNNFRFFRPEMNFHVNERVRIENGLRNAIRHDEFTLHYQPQVDITRNRVVGVEALLRWNSKEGNVPPAQFIPFAEDSGMIMEIGEWVLRTACRDARVWQDTGAALCVAVNISGRQLHHAAFVETIRSVLDDTGLDPAHLELEITEGILMQDIENTISKLQALNDIGVRIAMDDFGTGYSSMISLKRLPFDRLKIDRCFIEDIAAGETVIVSAMVGLGLSLGLDVVAEGVETAGQIEFLKETGCGKVQGYYFARPMPLDNLRLFLQGWPTRSMAS